MWIPRYFTSSIRRKIVSSYVIVVTLFLLMAVGGAYQLIQVSNTARQVGPAGSQIGQLQEYGLALASLDANLDRFFVIGGPQIQEAIYQDLGDMVTALNSLNQERVTIKTASDTEALKAATKDLETDVRSLLEVDPDELNASEVNDKILSIFALMDEARRLHQELSSEVLTQLQTAAERQDSLLIRFIAQYSVLGSLVLVIMVIASIVVVRSIAAPIAALTETVKRIRSGDLAAQAQVETNDEIGQLAEAFNGMTARLRASIDSLAERTQNLEMIAILSERLAAILNLEQLMEQLVQQVKERFDYYHVHIYLLDEESQSLVMAAGVGEAGAQMKAQGHRIPLDAAVSLVARAARSGEVIRVDNVRQAADWLPNPLLPDAHAEMTVPILLEGQVVGVLDVQEDEVGGLDEGDASMLRSLANQVAVAIRNARQFERVEQALAEARTLQAQYRADMWDREKVTRRNRGQVRYSRETTPGPDEALIEASRQQALAIQKPALVSINANGASGSKAHKALVAPIALVDGKIGDLQFHGFDPNRRWTEEELALVEAVIDQVGQAAESLRLFDQIQERASREQLIGQISDKLRRAPSMEALLETGVSELARVLGTGRAYVRFGSPHDLQQATRQTDLSGAAPADDEAEPDPDRNGQG